MLSLTVYPKPPYTRFLSKIELLEFKKISLYADRYKGDIPDSLDLNGMLRLKK